MRGHGPHEISVGQIAEGCVQARLRYQSGFEVRCTIVDTPQGRLAYSPIAEMGDEDFDQLETEGSISWLVAPNDQHHQGLAHWSARYPEAKIAARESAVPRLTKVSGLEFEALPSLEPPEAGWMLPEGVSNGEVWLQWRNMLLVGDACANVEGTFLGLAGRMSRWAGLGAPASPPKTWSLVTQSGRGYQQWVKQVLENFDALQLLPAHGSPIGPLDNTSLLEALGA